MQNPEEYSKKMWIIHGFWGRHETDDRRTMRYPGALLPSTVTGAHCKSAREKHILIYIPPKHSELTSRRHVPVLTSKRWKAQRRRLAIEIPYAFTEKKKCSQALAYVSIDLKVTICLEINNNLNHIPACSFIFQCLPNLTPPYSPLTYTDIFSTNVALILLSGK